jgi:putative membrane protein
LQAWPAIGVGREVKTLSFGYPERVAKEVVVSTKGSNVTGGSVASSESRFEVAPNVGNHFAFIRTRLALERTMMAWVRTAVALIGFGFTIVQFFERLSGLEGVAAAARPFAPRYVGLALIGTGVLVLAISAWQYHRLMGYLWTEYRPIAGDGDRPIHTPTYAVMILIMLIGVFAFLAVLTRAL